MNNQRGAALVETAISLSLLLLLVMGVIEVGRYVTIWHGANTAAREGARYGIAVGNSAGGVPRYTDCSEIIAATLSLSGLANLQISDVSVTYDDGSGGPVHDCDSGGDPNPADINEGDRVVVTVTRSYQPMTPLAGPILGPLTVTASDSRTIFLEATP